MALRSKYKLGIALSGLILSIISANQAGAYPNGPLMYVTDAAPHCAGCHSSVDEKRQFPEKDDKFPAMFSIEQKHLKLIKEGKGSYSEISEADRKALIDTINKIDENAKIEIEIDKKVLAPGEMANITVKTKGGSGPVIGVALVDSASRFQSRPIASSGWYVEGAPVVRGPEEWTTKNWKKNMEKWGGKEKEKNWEDKKEKWAGTQTDWVDQRMKGTDNNLSFVIIYGINSNVEKNQYPEGEVKWQVRAPMKKGNYAVTAVFFYGTEKASPQGTIKQVGGDVPRGGFAGPSGRVMFSKTLPVLVK